MSSQACKGTFGGAVIEYDARVDDIVVVGKSEQATARYVYTSYCRTDVEDRNRPVIFAFNGGPGSSSVWLHLGLGPRRPADADALQPRVTPPFDLVDNTDCVLDVADLVFIDPPGTGFSRVLNEDDEKDFYALVPDAVATIRFIAEWARRSHREHAPKILMGESYGAMRAAAIAKLSTGGPTYTGSLETQAITGIILLGAGLGLGSYGEDVRLANALPSLAATAWYHNRLPIRPADLLAHLKTAIEFAGTEYLTGLYAGHNLDTRRREHIAERLHELIGIPPEVARKHDLRINTNTFAETLLADKDCQVGLYDSRYTLPIRARGDDPVADDPAMGQYVPAFAGAITAYLRDELHADYDDQYRLIEFSRVNSPWDYGNGAGVMPDTNHAVDIATAMRRNRSLEILVGSGHYDLVATAGGIEYALSHAPLDRRRLHLRRYESGHMPYLGEEARRQVTSDIREFLQHLRTP